MVKPPSPAQIRRLRAAAAERIERLRAELATAIREEELFAELEALHPNVNSTTTDHSVQADSKNIAISKGRSGKDAFLKTIRAKGYTLRSLAKRLECKPSLLSMQRKGDRPIPYERAKEIERLTGWPATAKTWPGGLS